MSSSALLPSELRESLLVDIAGEDETDALTAQLSVSMADPNFGLDSSEAAKRLADFGYNQLEEKKENLLVKFLSYFSGPMPLMIWVAVLLEFVSEQWIDFCVLLVLQLLNGLVGFVEELNAGDAVNALKASLAPRCTAKRDGRYVILEARVLVPGDVVNLKLGDVVPADCVLLDGPPLEVDQAALTGESLPVTVYPGEGVKMGATIKRGEILAHVTATGKHTFFGKAAALVNSVDNQGRFQLVMFQITATLLAISIVCVTVILVALLSRGVSILRAISVCLVLLVASIPIATQMVCTSTMAMGARALASQGVIVAKLSAIEEMAGMSILCSDKTGTLTLNELQLFEPVLVTNISAPELTFVATLAAKRMDTGMDAIDTCLVDACKSTPYWSAINSYQELDFHPFDPVSKRTEATVRGPDGAVFRCMKGAPQVVLRMCNPSPELEMKVSAAVQEFADRGYRSLGVARTDDQNSWVFLGLLSLFDPPRTDTQSTIQQAQLMGIEVKMITGDQTAIAKETCRRLGMGTNILGTEVLDSTQTSLPGAQSRLVETVYNCNGFAEVYPEHKFQIVQILMDAGYTTGMTGDGVNDAPALKRSHIGIAVHGATDAARAAADIVLTKPGLSEIISALLNARKIFARVRNYCIYRIASTVQLAFFFFVVVLGFNMKNYYPSSQRQVGAETTLFGVGAGAEQETIFTLPVIALVLITILNDGTIITICRDKVTPAARPQSWNLFELFAVATSLGMFLVLENVLIFLAVLQTAPGSSAGSHCGQSADDYDSSPYVNPSKCEGIFATLLGSSSHGTLSYNQLKSCVYLALSLSAFLTVFAARCVGPFYERAPGRTLFTASVFAVLTTSFLAAYANDVGGLNMDGLESHTVASVWLFVVMGFLVQDFFVKKLIYTGLAFFQRDQEIQQAERRQHNVLSNKTEAEKWAQRSTIGGSKHSHGVFSGRSSGSQHMVRSILSDSMNASLRVLHLEHKVEQLENYICQLKQVIDTLQASK